MMNKVLKSITVKNGIASAIGHSWTVIDYKTVGDKHFEVHYLYVIDEDRILKKELKRIDITEIQ